MRVTTRGARGAWMVMLVACAEPTPRNHLASATLVTSPVPTPADGGANDGACKKWEEIVQTLEGAPILMFAIAFERNSDALTENARLGIEKTASLPMLQGSRPRIRRFAVVGHADADERGAQQLSERRANAVMQALVNRGIVADRMESHGVGAARVPGAPPGTNRLVLFQTLVDYRGGIQRWVDGGFIDCDSDRSSPECGPTSEYTPRCLER